MRHWITFGWNASQSDWELGMGMGMNMRRFVLLAAVAASIALSLPAAAASIVLSDESSNGTPASFFDANFDFSVVGTTLTLVVTNTTIAPDEYNLNEIYFNASSSVTSLSLTSAMHSAEGDVLVDWAPLFNTIMADGFGDFDYGLQDGMGETDPSVIGSNEFLTLMFSITGTGPFSGGDFIETNADGYAAGAKFVNGPGDDSGFGASVPEPGTAMLLGAGLLVLGARQRARRNG